MFYLIFGVLLLGLLLLSAKWYSTAEPKDLIRMLKIVGLVIGLGVAAYFILSGRMAMALVALPVLLPWVRRILFIRQMAKGFQQFRNSRSGNSSSSSRSAPGTDMSRAEALEVLGLQEGASEDEIKQAHKRLINNVHPDHGGSTYLAAKINRAKSVLLG